MAKNVIIVESPAKIKTIRQFVGPDYDLAASMGHVRDLPKSKLGVDLEGDFVPQYEDIPARKATLTKLRKAVKGAQVYLATDPDREGEAIAWHLAAALKLKSPRRIEFNEITRSAVQAALQQPREINEHRVNAQQARRVLDRLGGYELSPLLWRKVKRGLSAGRVQSVAVKLICDREAEREAFVTEEYWTITATLSPAPPDPEFPFPAKLLERDGEKIKIPNQEQAAAIVADLRERQFTVAEVREKEQRRNPPPPFITSTLQQDASRRLRFSAHKTMLVAQQLYEGLELGSEGAVGLITYMRTDAVRVAAEALAEARQYISERIGAAYLPQEARVYRSRRGAQEAHEAIRPTSVNRRPEEVKQYLDRDQYRLYELIWQRFLASQMEAAVLNQVAVDITAGPYLFRANSSAVKFDGFYRIYGQVKEENGNGQEEEQAALPPLRAQQPLRLLGEEPLLAEQHFTEPPPRYSEATLVKELEANGIGRPSTYAPIIQTIQARNYVYLENRRFVPTPLGRVVTRQLVRHFTQVIDIGFTAQVEEKLDTIEEGKGDWVAAVRDFYGPFHESVEKAQTEMVPEKVPAEETGEVCENCGKPMVKRFSRRGPFLACSGYPECKTTKPLTKAEAEPSAEGEEGAEKPARRQRSQAEPTDHSCEKCGKPMVIRSSRRGRFLGCSGYPKCRNAMPLPEELRNEADAARPEPQAAGRDCPECGKPLLVRSGRRGPFIGCSGYPKCKHTENVAEAPAATEAAEA